MANLVSVYTYRNYLYLNWRYEGKRYRLATGLVDELNNREALQAKIKLIESDILYQRVDTSLVKYGKKVKVVCPVLTADDTSLLAVWGKFCEFKFSQVTEQTMTKYMSSGRDLKQFFSNSIVPEIKRSDARNFLNYLKGRCEKRKGSLRVVREQIGYFSAMWQWGISEGLIRDTLSNPFAGLTKEVKPAPKQPPKPFTEAEVIKILKWFSLYNLHYLPYVKFLLLTGCRISEAIGLKISHVDSEAKTIWIGESLTRGTRKTTKTNKARVIPMNNAIEETIFDAYGACNRKNLTGLYSELVFVSPQGRAVNDHNFNQRIWKKCLSECSIPYRKPYNCRHTFISHLSSSLETPAIAVLGLAVRGKGGQSLCCMYRTKRKPLRLKSGKTS